MGGEDIVEEAGIFVDDITKKGYLLDPERHIWTEELIKLVDDYSQDGQAVVENLKEILEIIERMKNRVDIAKNKLLNLQSAILRIDGDIEKEEHELNGWIWEKRNHIEKMRTYIEGIQRLKNERQELLLKLRN